MKKVIGPLFLVIISSIIVGHLSIIVNADSGKVLDLESSNTTPTQGPTFTPPPDPGGTNTPTPVEKDYLPVVLGMNTTPTTTPTVPILTPTQDPTSTPAPVPGVPLIYP